MPPLNILLLGTFGDGAVERIAAVDPSARVVDARGKFEVEYAETWPAESVHRYVSQRVITSNPSTRAERDALLAAADIICLRFPFPLDLRSRAPRLKWLHQTPAGASNLRRGDIWGSDVLVTTSRGLNNAPPIAEYVLATIFMFAKSLPHAFHDQARRQFDRRQYRSVLIQDKTVGIIGLGGIGSAVARLAAAVGMRVLATRRSVTAAQHDVQGVDELLAPSDLPRLLEHSDFVVLSTQWTPQTEKIIGAAELRLMKSSACLVNVARGELIDQPALIRALDSGEIAAAALDVYVDEFSGPPPEELWRLPNVLITPHTSVSTDVQHARGIELFCDNLRRHLKDEPLLNILDWERGY